MHILLKVFKYQKVTFNGCQDTLWPCIYYQQMSLSDSLRSWTNCWISPKSSSVTSAADDKVNRWPLEKLKMPVHQKCPCDSRVHKTKSLTTKVTYSWITWPYYIYIRQDSFFCKPFLRIQDPNKTTTGKQSILQSQTVWKCLKCQDTFAGFL